MALTTTVSKVSSPGDGVSTVFPYGFKIFKASDLVVTSTSATGVKTTLALTTDYTLSGVGDDAGGNVTCVVAPASGTTLTLQRVPELTQETSIRNEGAFYAQLHEDTFDKLTMSDQYLQQQITDINSEVGAGPVESFNGRHGVVVPISGDYPASLIPFTPPGTGAVPTNLDADTKARFSNFEGFGAKGDGVTDDTAAIQVGLNSGRTAFMLKPGSTYIINGGLTCSTAGMTLLCYGATVKLKNSAGSLGMLTLSGAGSSVYGGTWDGNSANGNATGSIYNSFGVCMDNSNMIVRDTIHLNQYGIGIKGTYKARYMTAEKNNITGTTGYGIYIDGATIANGQTANQTHNRAIGNFIDMTNGGTTGQGILFTGVLTEYQQEYFEVSGNTVIGPQGALGASAINLAVRGNRGIFANNRTKYGSMGISEGGSDTTYTGNIITDLQGTVANGIEPSGANCTITGNTIRDAINGINADTSSTYDGMSIVGNRISASANPIRLQVGSSFTGRNITISGNTLVNSTGKALIYTTNDITNLGICGNTMTGPGSATSGSRGIYINTPLASAQVFVSGNKISGVERALTIYSASATTFTDLISIANNRTSDVGSSSAGWSTEGSAILGARVVAAYDSDSGGVQRRWLDQANNIFELWGNSFNNPNSNLTAGVGSMYYPTIGNKGAWRKESGTGNTGWVNLNPIASTASTPSLNIPVGVTDSSPANGDLWNDANGTLNFKGNLFATGYEGRSTGTAVASASTITPTGQIFHITGSTTVNTINLPYTGFTGTLLLITDSALTFGTAGNISNSIPTVAGQSVLATYDGTKWSLLSVNIGTSSNSVYIPQGTTAGTVDYTGATDSTTNLQALLDAAPQGTTFLLGIGTPKFNVIIRRNGVIMQGPGQAQFTGGMTSYWQPFDVTKPVVQISDDLASYNGSGVINAMLYTPSGTGQKGLVFAGGAAKCIAVNVFSLGFTVSCIEFRHDDAFPCTFNMASNIAASTNVVGGTAFYFYDHHCAAVSATSSTSGTTLTIGTMTSGSIAVGAPVTGGTLAAGTKIVKQLTGTPGGSAGATFQINISQTVSSATFTYGGNGWTTANQVSNFSATAAQGYQIVNDGAQTNSMSNGYVQNSYSSNGLLFLQTVGSIYTPRMNFGQVDVDSTTGFGGITVTIDQSAAVGSDFRGTGPNNCAPIMGQINTSGGAFWVKGHTTVNATFGVAATTLTVASVTGLSAGMQIVVPGAGTSGRNYTDQIVSISGSVLTLLNHNSATSVGVGTDVQFGDFTPMVDTGAVAASWNNGPLAIGTSNKNTFLGDAAGKVWQSNGGAALAPFSGTDFWTYMADKQMRFAATAPAVTVSSIVRLGTTITVTTSSAHNMTVGEPFNLTGITDFDGFNSVNGPNATAFQPIVATVTSPTIFTYTSPVGGGNTPANQAPTLVPIKILSFNRGRLEVPAGASNSNNGIAFEKPDGTFGMTFNQDNTTSAFYWQTPDQTNGVFNIRYGSSVAANTKGVRIGNNSVGDYFFINGDGPFYTKNAAAPSTQAGYGGIYSDSTDLRMKIRETGGQILSVSGTVYATTASTTIASSTTATSIISGTGIGSKTLAAATLTPGRQIRIKASGYFSKDTTTTPTMAFVVSLGGTTVCTIPATALPAATLAATPIQFEATITCRTTGAPGTVMAHAHAIYDNGITAQINADNNTATASVTTTGTLAVDVTQQWGTNSALNTFTIDQCTIELI